MTEIVILSLPSMKLCVFQTKEKSTIYNIVAKTMRMGFAPLLGDSTFMGRILLDGLHQFLGISTPEQNRLELIPYLRTVPMLAEDVSRIEATSDVMEAHVLGCHRFSHLVV